MTALVPGAWSPSRNDSMLKTAIGIDIGGTNLRAGRVSERGDVAGWISEKISKHPGSVLDRLSAICRCLNDGSVRGIGIGVPGRVDSRRRIVLSGGYLDLGQVKLVECLELASGLTVNLDNDCNMALVAEMTRGAAQGASNVVMFTIGTGIGGAVATDGRILRGRATAGQLGHLTIDREGVVCACGRSGCVETMSSGTALGRMIAEAGMPSGVGVDDLFERERRGDPSSTSILDRWAKPLRAAIDSMVAAVDPELVLLGGGLGHAAFRALARAPARSEWYQCPIAAAQLGDSAGVIGAALAVFTSGMGAYESLIEHETSFGARGASTS